MRPNKETMTGRRLDKDIVTVYGTFAFVTDILEDHNAMMVISKTTFETAMAVHIRKITYTCETRHAVSRKRTRTL